MRKVIIHFLKKDGLIPKQNNKDTKIQNTITKQ